MMTPQLYMKSKKMNNKTNSYKLSDQQIEFYNEKGYLIISDLLTDDEKRDAIKAAAEIKAWPETAGKWMHYYERTSNGRQLCRTENFTPYHEGVLQLVLSEKLIGVLETLIKEPVVIFKEKINYKLPGGGGFAAHQDAPAYTQFGQPLHISVMIAVDSMYQKNGGLEVVEGGHKDGLVPQNDNDGTISKEYENSHQWTPLTCDPGDILFFGSYLPHRSGPNYTSIPRVAFYITYNAISLGNARDKYYEEKRRVFPPYSERDPGKDYSDGAKIYNLGNPIET